MGPESRFKSIRQFPCVRRVRKEKEKKKKNIRGSLRVNLWSSPRSRLFFIPFLSSLLRTQHSFGLGTPQLPVPSPTRSPSPVLGHIMEPTSQRRKLPTRARPHRIPPRACNTTLPASLSVFSPLVSVRPPLLGESQCVRRSAVCTAFLQSSSTVLQLHPPEWFALILPLRMLFFVQSLE